MRPGDGWWDPDGDVKPHTHQRADIIGLTSSLDFLTSGVTGASDAISDQQALIDAQAAVIVALDARLDTLEAGSGGGGSGGDSTLIVSDATEITVAGNNTYATHATIPRQTINLTGTRVVYAYVEETITADGTNNAQVGISVDGTSAIQVLSSNSASITPKRSYPGNSSGTATTTFGGFSIIGVLAAGSHTIDLQQKVVAGTGGKFKDRRLVLRY
jgi:hypothetical protein